MQDGTQEERTSFSGVFLASLCCHHCCPLQVVHQLQVKGCVLLVSLEHTAAHGLYMTEDFMSGRNRVVEGKE